MPLPSFPSSFVYKFTHSQNKFQHNGFACKIAPVPNAIVRLDICPPESYHLLLLFPIFLSFNILGSHPVFWSFSHPRSCHVLQFWTTCYTAMEFYLHFISVFFAQFPASLIFLFCQAQLAHCPPPFFPPSQLNRLVWRLRLFVPPSRMFSRESSLRDLRLDSFSCLRSNVGRWMEVRRTLGPARCSMGIPLDYEMM